MKESASHDNILSVENLSISFGHKNDLTKAVDGISFSLRRGQCLGIVGESGSGKSVTSLSILKLLSDSSSKVEGDIKFASEDQDHNITSADEKLMYTIRGKKISMVFQEPMNTLNPVRTCGSQVKEVLDVHGLYDSAKRKDHVLEFFNQVSLPEVERIYNSYPHELSGGQLQRVCIAMAIATSPDILICDEPTTALDVTVQKEIIDLLKDIVRDKNMSMIFISHDLDVVTHICDSALVMYQGEIVEQGPLPQTFLTPKHPYTQALIQCKPTPDKKEQRLHTVTDLMKDSGHIAAKRESIEIDRSDALLDVTGLKIYFPNKRSWPWQERTFVKAVDDISFSLYKKEILGVVGESGSGKSTLAKTIAGLLHPTVGKITYKDKPLDHQALKADKKLRTQIQLVFQDPYSSLNPQLTIGAAIREPLKYHKIVPKDQVKDKAISLLEEVGQILNLLDDLRSRRDISMLFISHDLSVVHYLCDRILVMKEGKVVEQGQSEDVMLHPQHPYTRVLIDSIPKSIDS